MDTGAVVMSAASFAWFGSLLFGLPRSSLVAYYYKRMLNTFDLWQHRPALPGGHDGM